MGRFQLLTREGEVAVAKRIEAGQREVEEEILKSPIMLDYVIRIGEQVEASDVDLREVFEENEEAVVPCNTTERDETSSCGEFRVAYRWNDLLHRYGPRPADRRLAHDSLPLASGREDPVRPPVPRTYRSFHSCGGPNCQGLCGPARTRNGQAHAVTHHRTSRRQR